MLISTASAVIFSSVLSTFSSCISTSFFDSLTLFKAKLTISYPFAHKTATVESDNIKTIIIIIAFFALELLYKLDRYDSKKIFFTCLFIIAFNTMCASFWEFFEFISDNIFGKDAQNVLTTGVNDTMMDMILASLGSLTFVITYIFEEFNNKKLIVKNFIEQL